MMKKFTLLLFIIASTSCAVKQKPTFIKVDNIKLITANSTKITVSADALFNNPNVIGGRQTWPNISSPAANQFPIQMCLSPALLPSQHPK